MRYAISLFLIWSIYLNLFSQGSKNSNDYLSITGDVAWCWFSDPRAVAYKGIFNRTYIGWVTSEGDIEIAAFDNKSGEIEKFTLQSHFQIDDHTNPSILFKPDGRLLVFFSQHGGTMHVAESKNPEDISSWNTVNAISHFGTNVCYSNPVQLSSENNRIYLFFRGSDWQPQYSFSDDGARTWSDSRVLIRTLKTDNSQRPYLKISGDGKSRIDIAFTDGHPRNEAENSVYHVYYQKGNFYQTNGTEICGISELPFLHSQGYKVYDGSETKIRAWVWDIATDANHRPVIVYTRLPGENDHRYHYASWNGEKWSDTELVAGGSWFPQTPDQAVEREPHYSGGIVLDHNNPSLAYLSRPINGIFEIEKWTVISEPLQMQHDEITHNSATGNIRPVVVRNYSDEGPKLLWMNISGHYIHYTDYSTSIKCNMEAKTRDASQAGL